METQKLEEEMNANKQEPKILTPEEIAQKSRDIWYRYYVKEREKLSSRHGTNETK